MKIYLKPSMSSALWQASVAPTSPIQGRVVPADGPSFVTRNRLHGTDLRPDRDPMV